MAAIAGLALASFAVLARLNWRALAPAAFGALALEAWALRIASSPGAGVIIAPLFGAVAAAIVPRPLSGKTLPPLALATCALILTRSASGREACALLAVALALPGSLVSTLSDRQWLSPGKLASSATFGAAGLLIFAYLGATTPAANWFGSAVSHGPRSGDEVALTFDDGPDVTYTLRVASILQSFGVKGTFFLVGKALDVRPDIARQLLASGHELGDHSYHHDAISWLRPDYPEISLTQSAFKRNLGICPTFFRPPHGTRTPFMTSRAASAGMKTVVWDVSAADWATSDGALVARRVLAKVRPGSIILLHDGLDGKLQADRSVLLNALPVILRGLRERGLQPVLLSQLLGVPAQNDSC